MAFMNIINMKVFAQKMVDLSDLAGIVNPERDRQLLNDANLLDDRGCLFLSALCKNLSTGILLMKESI